VKIYTTPFENDDKFFFNISANVGLNSLNKTEDVQLVQFGYFAIAQNNFADLPQELRTAAGNVVPGASYAGAANDPLTIAIKVDQKVRGGTQDGHVSVIRGATTSYDGGSHIFLLARLVNNIRSLSGKDFPRIDKHPKCPPALAASVRRCFEV